MNGVRNRQIILAIIKKRKALEKKDINARHEEHGACWTGTSYVLDYWKFLKDLEEGKIKHLYGKKVG